MDAIAEYFVQMSEPQMKEALQDYAFNIKDTTNRENAKRIVKNAKGDYQELWWGLASFLFLGDYTASRTVWDAMKRPAEIDTQLQFLITNIAPLRHERGMPSMSLVFAAMDVLEEIKPVVSYFELASGYFRRNTNDLQEEWEDILLQEHRLRFGTGTYEDLYTFCLGLLKFRLFIIGFMPVEVMVV